MTNIFVAGIGTNVGKTICSAILTALMRGDYWKPIQCGDENSSDTSLMHTLIDKAAHRIHLPAYSLKAPRSPHAAARLEGISINVHSIVPPKTPRTLIIEGVGGILTPLTPDFLSLDLFKKWDCRWVIVSRHYLGSINHTLLTINALKQAKVSIAGIIFNGKQERDSEEAILSNCGLPFFGRLLPEASINNQTIKKYKELWQPLQNQLAL